MLSHWSLVSQVLSLALAGHGTNQDGLDRKAAEGSGWEDQQLARRPIEDCDSTQHDTTKIQPSSSYG